MRLFVVYILSLLNAVCCLTLERPTLQSPKRCAVARSSDGSDDTPSIIQAFKDCEHDGIVIFDNGTYHVNSVMNITNLRNVRVELNGKLLWSDNVEYWLKHSMPVGYQNQSTAWYLGGDNITFEGFGKGTFDGNGQTWYEFVNGISNYPRRPMGLTIYNTRDSIFQGLRFIQSQMWTMTIIHSQNVLLQDIYVNSTSNVRRKGSNTDGADTFYVNNVTFKRWTVANGDDGISLKANSTNIIIEDSTLYGGAIALGSIGQYMDVYETIENVTVRNITYLGGFAPVYAKTWTGKQKGYPPNGGGGGLGVIRNITANDITVANSSSLFLITQCVHWNNGGIPGDCDTSQFKIEDINISNVKGNLSGDTLLSLKCSPRAPCSRIKLENIMVKNRKSGLKPRTVICENVKEPAGFQCPTDDGK